MVTNLPPQAKALMREYQEARSLPERISKLEALISAIPEHKGTEKLLRNLKRTLAKLKRELKEKESKRAKSSSGIKFSIKREGAGQVIIVGNTMSGKSSLLSLLTNSKPQIGSSPFTTKTPIPGMMEYLDVKIQLVEAPAICIGVPWINPILSLCRNASGIIFLADLSSADVIGDLKFIFEKFKNAKITLKKPTIRVEIEKRTSGGIHIFCSGNLKDCNRDDIIELLRDYGVKNALVRIWGDAKLSDIENYIDSSVVYKPSILIANKMDIEGAEDNLIKLEKALKGLIKIIPFSCIKPPKDLSEIKASIYNLLDVIRIYTKEVGGEVSSKPLVVPKGSKVIDIAKIVHSQLYENFAYAKVWGSSVKFNGERVGPDHILNDGDIVEIRTR
ncbi:MAG: TGS domain-containing protein [Candidatus Methanomethylicia archaeon]|nr:TGS domain-containing protein [Candidatus Methanomethylicia archaeon]MDW7988505.1 TGS domain-containing protein [Nitrososphaerota archaeon]